MYTPVSLQELDNARQDVKSLEKVINGNENEDVTTRLGETYPTINKAVKQLFENGGLPATPFETKALMIASSLPNGAYAVVTNDAIANIGVYLKKSGAWNILPYNNLTNLNSLTINKDKNFPLTVRKRNNITSSPNTNFNSFLLDVVINNADKDYYYRVGFYANGTTDYVDDGSSWIIEKVLKADYETANNTAILLTAISQKQPAIIRNSGIHRIELTPTAGFGYTEQIFITVDSNALPASGYVRARVSTDTGYSYTIDDSRIILAGSKVNYDSLEHPLLKYSGEVYPFIKKTYGAVTSKANQVLLDSILDIQVLDAEPDYLYNLAYYTNGNTALGADKQERWIFNKRPSVGYDAETAIVDVNVVQPTLTRSGVQTITLNSKGLERFKVTINTDKLPAYGTYIRASLASSDGYSWAVNPDRYFIAKKSSGDLGTSIKNNYVVYDALAKSISYRYKSNGTNREYKFGNNGANSLPNFMSMSKSTDNLPLEQSVMTLIQSAFTDWLPPLIFYAKNGDDGGSKSEFTGGNHLVSSKNTAKNTLFLIFVDGAMLDMSKNFAGEVSDVSLVIGNQLQASNTLTSEVYALEQSFRIKFDGEHIMVSCVNKALQELYVKLDYGVQMTTAGFQETQLFVGGSQIVRTTFDNLKDSGSRLAYPEAWAVALKSASNGTLMSYMQRNFGAALATNGTPSEPLIKGGGTGNTKFYHSAWNSRHATESEHLHLLAGQTYEWRGGYVMQAATNSTTPDDTIAEVRDGIAIIKNGQDYMII